MSSTSTALSEARLAEATHSSSPTSRASTISTPCTLSERELRLRALLRTRQIRAAQEYPSEQLRPKLVSISMKDGVLPAHVATDMSAQAAQDVTTLPVLARKRRQEDPAPIAANKRPRHLRGFLWGANELPVTPLASLTESMAPLPSPPLSEVHNDAAWTTIRSHPHLFSITTPVKVDEFECLLAGHPNRALVDSVCRGFREGFWPFADIPHLSDFPDTWEESTLPLDEKASEFAAQYVEDEEKAGRYSSPFYGELLPGMYSMPIHAVPKPHSDKLRFINNHSAGKFSLNSMIDKLSVGMRPDNVRDLARNLLHFRRSHGDAPITLFKSSNAYRLLPMHPLWQLKQIVTINGMRRVDRCCCFGNRGSPDLFCTFMGLVLWIAINVRGLLWLLAYMDDVFSWDLEDNLVPYHGYGTSTLFPSAQARLLTLWDDLGIPHSPSKQLYGEQLVITGFLVDSRAMSITLPEDSRCALMSAIHSFLADAPRRRRPLREWQRILGWINWGLNVRPLLRPALQSSYTKIAGLSIPHTPVYINARVTRDLRYVASVFARHGGVHLITATAWGPADADLIVFCDACLSGMAFWISSLSCGFVADCPSAPPTLDDNIFWFEALTVLAALEWVVRNVSPLPRRLAIYTDNLNTVQMFDSHRGNAFFDELLLVACEHLLASHVDLRVWHVPGHHNTVADALSRGLFTVALQYAPALRISTFIPPRPTLGDIIEC